MDLNRRLFLKGVGLAATGAALASVTGCADQSANAEQNPNGSEQSIEWGEEADFVVIGFGSAGMGAAKQAVVDKGCSVIVLESGASENEAGGSLACNSGTWPAFSVETFVNCSLGGISEALASRMVEAVPSEADWLGEQGLEWSETVSSSGAKRRASPAPGRGYAIWKTGYTALKKMEGLTIHFGTQTTDIVKGEDGSVHGVLAEIDGETRYIKAKKGVVICTGGYAGNKSLIQGNHYVALPYESCTAPTETGEGIFLAARAGAKVMQNVTPCVEFFGWAFKKASEEMGTAMVQDEPQFGGNDAPYARVFIDYNGKRFMNEDFRNLHDKSTNVFLDFTNKSSRATSGNLGNGYDHLPFWTVYDAKTLAAGPLWITQTWTWAKSHELYDWSKDNQKEVEKGWIMKADTLEELASMMKSTNNLTGEVVEVDPETLVATIEEYNGYCEKGEDPLGKAADYLKALDTPPYYAVETVPSIGYTNQGLTCNDDSQVLDWNDQAIPRLYAAGDIGSGMRSYTLGCSGAWVRGAFAVQHGATLDDWDKE